MVIGAHELVGVGWERDVGTVALWVGGLKLLGLQHTGARKAFPCHHCFHADCIGSWLGVKHTCPLCVARIVPSGVEEGEPWTQRRLSDLSYQYKWVNNYNELNKSINEMMNVLSCTSRSLPSTLPVSFLDKILIFIPSAKDLEARNAIVVVPLRRII